MQKKIYGLIGYPVSHSLSPFMHNAAFRALKIDAQYNLFPLSPQDFDNFLLGLKQNNICGFNVTIPYKEKILPFLNEVSDEVKLIGAANTVLVKEGRLEGFNTDGRGFYQHLTEDLGFSVKDKRISLLGAGGAARAISVYLAKGSPEYIFIYDLDLGKAKTLVEHLRHNFPQLRIEFKEDIAGLDIPHSGLLVNATPIGMKEADSCLIDKELLHKNLLVYDLIYNPKETKLLKAAGEKGATVSNGLNMLLYQGMFSFEIWTGIKPLKEVMQQALLSSLSY